jgi:hypothetical protein
VPAAIAAKQGYPDLLVSCVIITKDQIEAYAQHSKYPETLTTVDGKLMRFTTRAEREAAGAKF